MQYRRKCWQHFLTSSLEETRVGLKDAMKLYERNYAAKRNAADMRFNFDVRHTHSLRYVMK